jgi:hypothetical protein
MGFHRFSRLPLSAAIMALLVLVTPWSQAGAMPSAAPPAGAAVAVLPNVLIIFDVSGSMKNNVFMPWNFGSDAYDPDPDVKYYGIFDPDQRYRYIGSGASGYFIAAPLLGNWSGKFLNWICTTRIDVARYVLYGGKVVTDSGDRYIIGNNKTKNTWDNDSSYPYTGPRMASYDDGTTPFLTPYGGLGTYSYHHRDVDPNTDPFATVPGWSVFDVYDKTGTYVTTYNIRQRIPNGYHPRGFLHDLPGKVRLGLMFFNGAEGGNVRRYVKKFEASEVDLFISDINGVLNHGQSHAWTPLAESLYEATRFFAQDSPYYFASDYTASKGNYPNDPMYNED